MVERAGELSPKALWCAFLPLKRQTNNYETLRPPQNRWQGNGELGALHGLQHTGEYEGRHVIVSEVVRLRQVQMGHDKPLKIGMRWEDYPQWEQLMKGKVETSLEEF